MTPPSTTAAAAPDAPLDIRRRRLLFRANHRGTQENDLLIGGFVAPRIAGFSDTELTALETILDYEDVALADWLCGRQPIPPEYDEPMIRAIRDAALVRSVTSGSGPHPLPPTQCDDTIVGGQEGVRAAAGRHDGT